MSDVLSEGISVSIRRLELGDLARLSEFAYTVSITEPLTDAGRLAVVYAQTGMWLEDAGAAAIVETSTGRMVGTSQYYRSAPCIHGLELGYIIHDPIDRGKGFAAEALRLLSDHLFANSPQYVRQQLLIEVWNTASWKVAERCGFLREGVLRSSGFGADPADEFLYSRTKRDYTEQLASTNGA
ncbi:MAG: GNAT family N-acetyltransferase [Kordiimonadaceae bacterium]|nr:GNAT family N-acetyltransferase [Kordiimonadaceae bacterium]